MTITRDHVVFRDGPVSAMSVVHKAEIHMTVKGSVSRRCSESDLRYLEEDLAEKLRRLIYGELEEELYRAERDLVRKLQEAFPFGTANPEPIREVFRNLQKMIQWKKD